MKHCLVIFCITLLISSFGIAQSSWKSPDYKATTYRKVMVLAKTTDELAKRQIEDASVKLLAEKGITAIPSYSNVTAADIASEDAFMVKADSLQVDALVVYTLKGQGTQYKTTPSVNVSAGIPVRVGIFGGFLGGSIPIAGGAKAVNVVNAAATFYNRASKSMQWSYPLSGKLKSGTEKLANSFAKSTINAMIKDQLFVNNTAQ